MYIIYLQKKYKIMLNYIKRRTQLSRFTKIYKK